MGTNAARAGGAPGDRWAHRAAHHGRLVRAHKGVRLSSAEFGALMAAAIHDGRPVGVMFHHAAMDAAERAAARELLSLVTWRTRSGSGAHCDLSPARATKLAARHGLVDHGPDARPRAIFLRPLSGIAQIFPVDLGLPGLQQAAAPETMARLIRRNLGDVAVTVVSYAWAVSALAFAPRSRPARS